MERFTGAVDFLARVDVAPLVNWISGIAFTDWPQQHHRADLPLRPAMVSDRAWFDFGPRTDRIVAELMAHFPGCSAGTRLLSVVMPGQSIDPHTDSQPPNWICRVHVPLTSNRESRFIVGDTAYNLQVGTAYRVNTEAVHSVENAGTTPRTHFMFDIKNGD